MNYYSTSVTALIEELRRLPGIGPGIAVLAAQAAALDV